MPVTAQVRVSVTRDGFLVLLQERIQKCMQKKPLKSLERGNKTAQTWELGAEDQEGIPLRNW